MLTEELLNDAVARELNERLPGAVVDGNLNLGEVTLYGDPARVVEGRARFPCEAKGLLPVPRFRPGQALLQVRTAIQAF